MMRAMILAAGKGERMRPLTEIMPKPLLQVNHQPLIVYHLQAFAKAGITEIVINLGYLGEKIAGYLGNGQAFGVNIQYSYEDPILETAGGIKKALPFLGDRFMVVSADIFSDFDFSVLCHKERLETQSLAHLILTPNPVHHLKGDFGFIGETSFLSENVPSLYNFGGIALYQATFFDACPLGIYPLIKLWRQGILKHQVTGELYSGLWHNIGTPEQLQAVNRLLHARFSTSP